MTIWILILLGLVVGMIMIFLVIVFDMVVFRQTGKPAPLDVGDKHSWDN